MESTQEKPADLLLHACCGPCSMEPVRLLRERGMDPHIYYANSNITPADEYQRRLNTIRDWAASEQIAFTEGAYQPDAWEETVGRIGDAACDAHPSASLHAGTAPRVDAKSPLEETPAPSGASHDAKEPSGHPGSTDAETRRQARCRACYRLRFEESAAYAAVHGFKALGTTLSVSPYQYTDIIREELERACDRAGIACFFEDYSPQYAEATRRSRQAGMYRQIYCGCRFSEEEAAREREERKAARDAEKARRAAERAPEERRLAARRAERAAYDAKQARKRAVLKQLREERTQGSCAHQIQETEKPHVR